MKQNEPQKIYLILDNIRSMENVGSIFRTADAAGVIKIFLCGITPRPPRKEIDRAAVGAVDFVDWEYYEKVEEIISELRKDEVKIIALEQDKRSIQYSKINIEESCAIIIGNEIEGIRKSTLDLSDSIIEIPMYGQKNSLNVAVATGIALFDIIRKTKETND
jgi:23S rRNA (guanosine2251-2'-O)-methyltransferase